jgi:putative phosphoribosyl transferase
MQRFPDRRNAGRQLAGKLSKYTGRQDVIVLALPRDGVPVAYEVAQAIQAPLDVLIVRKLGLPGEEELALGAIALGGIRILNQDIIDSLAMTPDDFEGAGRWYEDFAQTTDGEVRHLLEDASRMPPAA